MQVPGIASMQYLDTKSSGGTAYFPLKVKMNWPPVEAIASRSLGMMRRCLS